MSHGGPDIGVVQANWDVAMTSSAAPTGDDDDRRTKKKTEAARGSAAPATGIGSEHVQPAETVRHAPELQMIAKPQNHPPVT